MGPGSLLGEEDVIGRNSHSSSCKCTSREGFLYIVEKEKFLEIVGGTPEAY